MKRLSYSSVKKFIFISMISLVGVSNVGYSLMKVQALGGYDTLNYKPVLGGSGSSNAVGPSFDLSVSFDPNSVSYKETDSTIPVGFGVDLLLSHLTDNAQDIKVKVYGYSIGAFVTVWSPTSFFNLTPFAKAGARLFSSYDRAHESKSISGLNGRIVYEDAFRGWDLALGLKCALFSKVSGLLQYRFSKESFADGKVKVLDVSTGLKGGQFDMMSHIVSLGFEVAI